jgi:5-formyltetrahydrofolate cyclo-ligase
MPRVELPSYWVTPPVGEGPLSEAAYWDVRASNWVACDSRDVGYPSTNLAFRLTGWAPLGGETRTQFEALRGFPATYVLFNAASLVWLILACAVLTMANKGPRFSLVFLPLAIVWATGLLTVPPVNELRYLFAFHLALPLGLALPFLKDRQELKLAMRKGLRERRQQVLPIERAKGEKAVCAKLLDKIINSADKSGYVAVYSAVGGELSVDELVMELLSHGYRIAYPAIISNGRMCFCAIDATSRGSLATGLLRSRPLATVNPKRLAALTTVRPRELRAVVVPGLAFDEKCNRMGMGGGYYDRYLPHVPVGVQTWGVAFDEQIVEGLPLERHDFPLTGVITPTSEFIRSTPVASLAFLTLDAQAPRPQSEHSNPGAIGAADAADAYPSPSNGGASHD